LFIYARPLLPVMAALGVALLILWLERECNSPRQVSPEGNMANQTSSENGHLYDLNQLVPSESGWVLLAAYRINAKGQVLAHGFYQGRTHACLLSPGQATAVKK
jgi:hypothetical protein